MPGLRRFLGSLFIVLGLISGTAAGAEQVFPALYRVTGVAADDVLNIRQGASAATAVLGTLAPDAKGVEVIAITDGWARVNSGGQQGYASARYLARETGADWNALRAALTCRGTEPFWSLAVDPARNRVTLSDPEGEDIAAIAMLWPGDPWHPGAALATKTGFATLTPGLCSDGMSDRIYGIRADLYRTGAEAGRYSGCCTLTP